VTSLTLGTFPGGHIRCFAYHHSVKIQPSQITDLNSELSPHQSQSTKATRKPTIITETATHTSQPNQIPPLQRIKPLPIAAPFGALHPISPPQPPPKQNKKTYPQSHRLCTKTPTHKNPCQHTPPSPLHSISHLPSHLPSPPPQKNQKTKKTQKTQKKSHTLIHLHFHLQTRRANTLLVLIPRSHLFQQRLS